MKILNLKYITIFALVGFLLSGTAGAGIIFATGGFNFEKKFIHDTETVEYKDYERIVIESKTSDVEIIPISENIIKLDYKGEVNVNNNARYEIFVEEESNELKIKVDRTSKHWFNFNIGDFSNDTTLKIELPSVYAGKISVNVVSGDFSISNFKLAKLSVEGVSGDVNLDSMLVQDLNAETVTGDIKVSDSNLNELDITTVSGEIELKNINDKQQFDYRIESVSGDVNVDFTEDVKFEFNFESVSGDIDNGFDVKFRKEDGEKDIEGSVGNGSANYIQIETVSGDITIE